MRFAHDGKERKQKMKMKKWMAMLVAGAMCAGMLAGCGSSSGSADQSGAQASNKTFDGSISFIISHKDEYLGTLDQAAKASAESKGCTLTSTDCADDMNKQIDYVRAAAENKADAIIIVLADDTRADEIVEAAGDTKVVFLNRIPQDESVLDENHVYVGSNEDDSGTYQGEMLADALKAEGKDSVNYLLFEGTAGLIHTTKRSEGMLKALDAAGITATAAADPVDCGYDRTKSMDQRSVMLAEGLDMSTIDCIIANNDAMALGVLESLRQNKVDTSHIKVVGVDGTNAGLQAISDGSMLATVYQNAVGQATAGVQAAINLASGADLTADISYETDKDNENIIWVPFEKITADNVEEYF